MVGFARDAISVVQATDRDDDFEPRRKSDERWLVRLFRSRVTDDGEAQDLAQEAILRFLRVAPAIEIEAPRAYLRRIAINLLRDRSKMAARRSASRHDPLEDHYLAGPSLESQLEARDMLRLVEAAMLELRPRTREVFMAVRVDGMTYAEVRAQTGYSSKIIEKEMARALAHLNRATGRD